VPFASSVADTTGFQIHSTLTVPLRTTTVLGAIQVLNKELDSGTQGEFTDADLEFLQEIAEYSSSLLHRMLDPKFMPNEEDAARFVARLTELPLVTKADAIECDAALIATVGDTLIRSEGVFPYRRVGTSSVAVLMVNPLDYTRREIFTRQTELTIEEVSVVSAPFFDALVAKYFRGPAAGRLTCEAVNINAVAEALASTYSVKEEAPKLTAADLEREDSAPMIQLINRLVEDAYLCGASDIHIEPTHKDVLVRYRIDGRCQDTLQLPKEAAGAIVARIKIMCNLDISECRLPQDGRIEFKRFSSKSFDIDLRVATGPVGHGEKVVLRILDKSRSALPLGALGFSDENLTKYRDCIRQPYGMILHCGPTGSGKSMTLYSALGELNTRDLNIQTAEDPIEYTLPGLNQAQMNSQIGLTFARALRSFLRMDPDVILVGEIRDRETAQIAVEAALTGHLLVSTLHTNDAPSTVARLSEMGVERFNISGSLVGICAQRLLRRVCRTCRIPYEPKGREEEIIQRALGWSGQIFKASPNGCPACGGQGYKTRIGIHELLINSEEITEAINKEAEVAELKRIAIRSGMKTLHQDSMLKVQLGITTMEESLATAPPDQTALNHHIAPITQFA
jgi:type IV pilus assembly protein PilB